MLANDAAIYTEMGILGMKKIELLHKRPTASQANGKKYSFVDLRS
jgi:hypothetical protein